MPASEHVLASMNGPAQKADTRILVVEDDHAVRRIIERGLTRQGYAVVSASTASEAAQLFRLGQPRFALVVSDVVLPDGTGPQLMASLREDRPDLRVVYMSGYGEEALGLAGSNETFLKKPFAPADLRQAVLRALAERDRHRDSAQDIG